MYTSIKEAVLARHSGKNTPPVSAVNGISAGNEIVITTYSSDGTKVTVRGILSDDIQTEIRQEPQITSVAGFGDTFARSYMRSIDATAKVTLTLHGIRVNAGNLLKEDKCYDAIFKAGAKCLDFRDGERKVFAESDMVSDPTSNCSRFDLETLDRTQRWPNNEE